MSDERVYTRAEVVRMFAEVGRRTGGNVLEHAFDAFPDLRVPVPRSPSTFEQQAAAAKRPSGVVPALRDTDPAMRIPTPPPPRESER